MNRLFTTMTQTTLAALLLAGFTSSAFASDYGRAAKYEVTITNITKGQIFSPPVLATHKSRVAFFTLGEPASDQLVEVAENGNSSELEELLSDLKDVDGIAAAMGPVPPGKSVTIEIDSNSRFNRLSLASMLVNTNDAFLAINSERLPRFRYASVTYYATAYDAGSEANNELCTYIPGPACEPASGNDRSIAEEAEGFVHVHNGVHGIADLGAAANDWRNPVAKIQIKSVR